MGSKQENRRGNNGKNKITKMINYKILSQNSLQNAKIPFPKYNSQTNCLRKMYSARSVSHSEITLNSASKRKSIKHNTNAS